MSQDLRATALLRWARAAVLACVVLAVSSTAHVSAGGSLPSVFALIALLAVTTLVLASLLGRPATRLRVVVLLAGGQAVLHVLMTAATGHVAAREPAGHAHMHEHAHAVTAHSEASASLLQTWLSHLQEDLSGPSLAMAAAHLVAAAALGLWVASGEHALWSLIVLLTRCPGPLTAAARVCVALRSLRAEVGDCDSVRRAAEWPEHVRLLVHLVLRSVVVRRGPPRLCGA